MSCLSDRGVTPLGRVRRRARELASGGMTDTVALPDLLLRAGAVMTVRDSRAVAAHYGSAAGELSVCIRGAGFAVRSDLSNLSIRGRSSALDRVVARAVDRPLMPGGATFHAGAWWCRS